MRGSGMIEKYLLSFTVVAFNKKEVSIHRLFDDTQQAQEFITTKVPSNCVYTLQKITLGEMIESGYGGVSMDF